MKNQAKLRKPMIDLKRLKELDKELPKVCGGHNIDELRAALPNIIRELKAGRKVVQLAYDAANFDGELTGGPVWDAYWEYRRAQERRIVC